MMLEFLLFSTAAGQRLLPVQQVVEVIPFVQLQKEASPNPLFRGLLNYRGKVLPVFDFAAQPDDPYRDCRSFLVVTRSSHGELGLVAEEVHHLLVAPAEDLFTIAASATRAFDVVKDGDAMIRIVDVQDYWQGEALAS